METNEYKASTLSSRQSCPRMRQVNKNRRTGWLALAKRASFLTSRIN